MQTGVIAGLVAVGVDFNAGVGDAVVVVIGVNHVENAVVVVVGVGRVWRTVVVVVRVEEVRGAIAVEVAVNNGGEGGCSVRVCQIDEGVKATKEARGRGALSVHSVAFPVDIIHATGVLAVFVERPKAGSIVKRSRCGHLGGDAGVVGVGVFNVENTIAVVVRVKVIWHAV